MKVGDALTRPVQQITGQLLGFASSFSKKAGLAPGSLVLTADAPRTPVETLCIRFDEKETSQVSNPEPHTVEPHASGVTWLHVNGLQDIALVQAIGRTFDLHDLALEDVLHGGQRPKIKDYDKSIFVTLAEIQITTTGRLVSQQVSVFFSPGLVISFSEQSSPAIENVRLRIDKPRARVRRMRGDYLAYCILDAVLDSNFIALDAISERVTLLEERMVDGAREGSLIKTLHTIRGQVMFMRRMVQPLREVARVLGRSESDLIQPATEPFLRDWHDHARAAFDAVDTLRQLLAEMLEIHLASMSIRMNQKMKTLTVMAGTFVPLTFIVGLYGMNFKNMPELNHPYGYFVLLGVLAAVASGLVLYFRKRKWF